MDVARGISRLGFRRWYERQLIESHGYLVTCFLCMIAVAATLEWFLATAQLGERVAMAFWAFLAGALGHFAWTRYKAIMARAEWLGDQATCRHCHAYARFRIIDASPRPGGRTGECQPVPFPPEQVSLLGVECKQCGNRWTI